jgi:stage IV sporulation protein FB
MGHFAGARLFNWRISRIELLPFGGAAVVEEHGTRPFREEVVVAILGPLQHLWLIGFCFIAYELHLISYDDFYWFYMLNITLLVFNLLPIWPLDGGKIAFSLCTKWMPFKYAQKKYLIGSGSLFLLASIWQLYIQPNHLNLWAICLFILIAHVLEWKRQHYVFMRFLLSKNKDAPSAQKKKIFVSPSLPLSKVTHLFMKDVTHEIIVKKRNPIIIAERQLLDAYFRLSSPESAIGSIFR